jgi:hypothetical protein
MFIVGKRDAGKGCWSLLAAVAGSPAGAAPVASYLQGMSLVDPAFVRGTTVTLFKQGHITPQACCNGCLPTRKRRAWWRELSPTAWFTLWSRRGHSWSGSGPIQ